MSVALSKVILTKFPNILKQNLSIKELLENSEDMMIDSEKPAVEPSVKYALKVFSRRQLIIFLLSKWYIILFLCVLFYIYVRYFYEKRIRWFNSAVMIKLDPETIEYSNKMAQFFYYYNYCKHFKLDCYNDSIKNNLYYHEIFDGSFSSNMNSIDTTMKNSAFENETFFKSLGEEMDKLTKEDDRDDYKEKYISDTQKLMNSNFRWTRMDKYKKKGARKDLINTLFHNYLPNISNKSLEQKYHNYMDDNSILNFVDVDSLVNNNISSIMSNTTLNKYGYYLNEPLGDIINRISQSLEEKYGESYSVNKWEINDILSNYKSTDMIYYTNDIPIKELCKYLFEQYKEVLFEYYDINDRVYERLKRKYGNMSDVDLDECPTEEDEVDKNFDNEDEQEQFETCMKILMFIESLEQRFNGEERNRFMNEIYFFVEHTVYTIFDVKSGNPIFPEGVATNIIYTYQTLIDYIYLYEKPDIIKQAVEFTIYYLLTPGEEKETRLESMVNMNVLMSEMFVMNQHYLPTLIDYSDKRNPSIVILKKLYDKFLKHLLNYFIIDGIANQWSKVFKFKRPERWLWLFYPLVQYLANTSISDILGILENFEERFINDDKIDKEEARENFFGGIGKIVKVFSKLPSFLSKGIKLLSNILNPFKLLEVIAKFVIILILLVLKLIFFTIKIGDVYIGEFIISVIAGLLYSYHYAILFAISYTFTFIMRHTDVYTGGFVYRFFYWMFGANENAPAAWYKRSGHHYGMHTCKPEEDDDDNEVEEFKQNVIEGFGNKKCVNKFQNKVSRMFLAYYPCGNRYKPDTELNGLMCARNMFQEPSHCLQSNIFRLRNNLKVEAPFVPERFMPTVEFTKGMKSKRKHIINQFKKTLG